LQRFTSPTLPFHHDRDVVGTGLAPLRCCQRGCQNLGTEYPLPRSETCLAYDRLWVGSCRRLNRRERPVCPNHDHSPTGLCPYLRRTSSKASAISS
jgi:hypothetical protein